MSAPATKIWAQFSQENSLGGREFFRCRFPAVSEVRRLSPTPTLSLILSRPRVRVLASRCSVALRPSHLLANLLSHLTCTHSPLDQRCRLAPIERPSTRTPRRSSALGGASVKDEAHIDPCSVSDANKKKTKIVKRTPAAGKLRKVRYRDTGFESLDRNV